VGETLDVVVLGAGVVGLACARALARAGREVFVIEPESGIGRATSSRNSGVIHAGLYYPRESWKARLCVDGARQLYAFCAEHEVAHQPTGQWILAGDASELPALAALAQNAQGNGVKLHEVSATELRAREPLLRAEAALWSPRSGVVDVHGLMEALARDLRAQGGQLVLGQRCRALHHTPRGWELELEPTSPTSTDDSDAGSRASETVRARMVVNAAGHAAPRLAQQSGVDLDARGLSPRLYRGDYLSMSPSAPRPECALVYPLPQRHGLGVHLTRDLGGRLRAGPDAYPVDSEDVSLTRLDARAWSEKAERFAEAVRRYLPGVEAQHLEPEFAGVRPKIERPGDAPTDFALLGPEDTGTPGIVHLLGIESPGLTACLAIAEWVAKRLESRTNVA
jgi:L-2-hydroxyglutarate oxidase LhgO